MTPHPTNDSQDIDGTLRALADEERRLAIRYLQDTSDGVASHDELQEYIATHSSKELTPDEIATRLHHVTLPHLAEAELLESDHRSETVRYQPDPLAERVLESIDTGPPSIQTD